MRRLAELTVETLYNAAQHGIRILLIVVAALVVSRIINRWIPRLRSRIVKLMLRHDGDPGGEIEKRAITFGDIFRKSATVGIYVLAFAMVLREAGFDIRPILAGAGVVGLALGFGAQNLVRDLLAGLFLLLENQIRLNDVVRINDVTGLVEEINLRTTVLRGADGAVHIFPNGNIQTLANLTREYSYYVFDLGVAYKEDTDRVVAVMLDVAAKLRAEKEFESLMLEPLEVLGVDRLTDSGVILKARIKTPPSQQWTVGREMNRRLKKRFEELGIELPFPQRAILIGPSPPQQPPKDA